jgi:UDP-N-acetylmuramyl pentapeptide phosphotransferase/UDP-N-acetylglucosamine-1-phosphate transferase
MSGGLGVLLAVAVLVPVGGDGFLLPIVESRLAIAMAIALGLLLVGMTRTYQRLNGRQRFWLQLAFATTAAIAGLIPSGVRPDGMAHVLGALFLVVSMNALRSFDSADGLASVIGAITAAVLALVASSSGAQAWGDLNLGLCGALMALLAYNVTHGRFRAELGTGGTLAVGFLLGASMLRLGEQTVPNDRVWLALPMALPLLNLACVLVLRHIRNRPLDIECHITRDHLHHQLRRVGLSTPQVVILVVTTTALMALVSLQFLGLL